jgi:hypothetical protein
MSAVSPSATMLIAVPERLVGALVDRGVAVNERENDGGRNAGQQPEPYASGKGRRRGRGEGAD